MGWVYWNLTKIISTTQSQLPELVYSPVHLLMMSTTWYLVWVNPIMVQAHLSSSISTWWMPSMCWRTKYGMPCHSTQGQKSHEWLEEVKCPPYDSTQPGAYTPSWNWNKTDSSVSLTHIVKVIQESSSSHNDMECLACMCQYMHYPWSESPINASQAESDGYESGWIHEI